MRFAHVTHLLAYMGYYIFRPLLLPILLLQRSLPIYFMFQCCYYFIYKRKRKKYQKQKTRQFVTLMLQATVHHQHVLRELKIQK